MQTLISVSILSADFSKLGEQIAEIEEYTDFIHFDVIDGHFAPNISFGIPILESLRGKTKLPFDVHLMVENPERFIDMFTEKGADIITVHFEATPHIHRALAMIKEKDIKAGVAINPGTPVSVLDELDDIADIVLIMGVNPGFGGQEFIPSTREKVRKARSFLNCAIEVDGGVTSENAKELAKLGANVLVAGAFIFKGKPKERILELKESLS